LFTHNDADYCIGVHSVHNIDLLLIQKDLSLVPCLLKYKVCDDWIGSVVVDEDPKIKTLRLLVGGSHTFKKFIMVFGFINAQMMMRPNPFMPTMQMPTIPMQFKLQ